MATSISQYKLTEEAIFKTLQEWGKKKKKELSLQVL